jgi:hypothetical protein
VGQESGLTTVGHLNEVSTEYLWLLSYLGLSDPALRLKLACAAQKRSTCCFISLLFFNDCIYKKIAAYVVGVVVDTVVALLYHCNGLSDINVSPLE